MKGSRTNRMKKWLQLNWLKLWCF